ncbi:MAG: PAP/fibrillin family protein [Planctomycetota bacterium]
MKRLSLIVALLGCLLAAGCGQSASERLVGKWAYDVLERAQGTDGEQGAAGGAKEAILGVAQAMGVTAGMEIEFRDDQTVTMSASLFRAKTPLSSKRGSMHWKVAKEEGETVTVEIRLPGDQNARKLEVTFVDEDHLRVAAPGTGGKSFVFTRVKQE